LPVTTREMKNDTNHKSKAIFMIIGRDYITGALVLLREFDPGFAAIQA
jgi:hypothetical protein